MMAELQEIQAAAGATFVDGVAVSFGNEPAGIAAARSGVALCDRAHWGRIQLTGADRVRFLHNQTTNDFQIRKPGQGCDTVFVTSTARTIDLATAYITEDAILLLVSPGRCQQLMQLMDRYIFPMDKVELQDISDRTACFSLLGPESDALMENILGTKTLIGQAEHSHAIFPLEDIEVRVAVGNGLGMPGYTLMVPAPAAGKLWSKIAAAGAVPMGDRGWEELRIQQGRPQPDRELTEDYNPLEAGLWQTISFEKGCYIGQETIARLNTYKGVKQQLWGIKLQGPAEPGTVIMVGEEKVGKLTSYAQTDRGDIGLGYIRTKAGGAGLQVQVGETAGEVVDVSFLTHEYV
ncbi:MAG: folate-binding protein YgfZ [Hormoscilla sp.]